MEVRHGGQPQTEYTIQMDSLLGGVRTGSLTFLQSKIRYIVSTRIATTAQENSEETML